MPVTKVTKVVRPASSLSAPPTKVTPAEATAAVRATTDRCMVSFSLGKDSWATWFALRPLFPTMVPVYFESIPDLPFIVDYIKYAEDILGTKIYRLSHPSMFRMLHNGVFLLPWQDAALQKSNKTYLFTFEDSLRILAEDLGWTGDDAQPWTAAGVRMADSPMRRAAMRKMGFKDDSKKKFYPIADMPIEDLEQLLRKHKVNLPVDYNWFGRSFDGINTLYTSAICEHDPESAAAIEKWFPLFKADIYRQQFRDEPGFKDIER